MCNKYTKSMNYIFSENDMPAKEELPVNVDNEKKNKQDEELKRKYRKAFLLNTREFKVLKNYCKKYRILNQSEFMRSAIMTAILKKYDEDAPTLFEVKKVQEQEVKELEKPTKQKPAVVVPPQPDLFSCLQQ